METRLSPPKLRTPMLSTSLVLCASIVLPLVENTFVDLEADLHSTHVLGSSGTTYETVRLYARIEPGSRIDAVYGNGSGALSIQSSGAFFQEPFGGPTSQSVNEAFFAFVPELEWDSYVSIGCLYSNGHPFSENQMQDIGIDWSGFEAGGEVSSDNGSWFITPADAQGLEQNGRVFLGQFSIPMGENLEVTLNLQGKDSNGETWQEVGAHCSYGYSDPTIFATGLRSPMGMTIASDGSVWVSQAGSGGADPSVAANDAGVARIDTTGAVEDVVTGLPSITSEGFSSGSADVELDSNGNMIIAQMGGADPLSFSALAFDVSTWSSGDAAQGPLDLTTQWNVYAYSFPLYGDSNPYGVAEGPNGNLYVIDSGANAIIKIERPSGTMSTFATFADIAQPNPAGPPFTHSVPTKILAHDDGFYVVNLTGFPFNGGAASVFNVDYSGNVTEIATGLSRATDVALDPRDGSLYVTQFTEFDLSAGPPWVFGTGTVARVTGTGAEVVANVVTPTGLAIADDGTMYVSSFITGLVHRYESASLPGVVYCTQNAKACPCANGDDGGSGCVNSTGAGATLSASGSPSLLNDTLVLTATGLVPSKPCLFYSGNNRVNDGYGVPFGDGLRCAGFEAVRIEVTAADGAGAASTSVEVSTNGQAYGHTLEVGESVNYQCWYRDDAMASPCGNSFNTTNGYGLRWNL
jgi:sugar lactone lactonase YvrE